MKKLFVFTLSLFTFHFSYAQTFSDSINQSVTGAINFLINSQQKKTLGTDYFKGEWPSYLTQLETSLYIGNAGDSAYDSNCFSSVMVHNILAEIVFTHPQFTRLIPALQLSLSNINTYKRGNSFSFWHVLPPAPWWHKKKHFKNPELYFSTRPNNYHYKGNFLNKYANIHNDADDTGLGYLAYLYSKKLNQKFLLTDTIITPSFLDSLYGNWRDTRKNRRSFSNYNFTYGYNYRTKAFLTWFNAEPFFHPFRLFFPYRNKPNLPMGNNDVDCVVNCNVIRVLNAYGLQNTPGFSDAISFISNALESEKHCFTCGNYYPSEFTLQYFASEAYAEGVTGLKDAISISSRFILSKQNANGSWGSELPENNFHVTALCVNALINSGIKTDTIKQSIENGIHFLLSSEKENAAGIFWTGGIFFSAGYTLRHTHVWRSDAVTVSLILEALVHYQDFSSE